MSDTTERLRKIKRFDQLVAYLRDELHWPIETEDFEDLTYDWEPDELGIDPKLAAKIQEIKQLRPLTNDQEWGIFFVKFEPKQLPVVAMRRLLNSLVLRKRASSQASDQAKWKLHDLLFVSEYGEGTERKITFAHFTEGAGNSIPTLKVLDWDGDDTDSKLQHVSHQLTTHLRWPASGTDSDTWRKQWSSAFTLRHRQVIRTAQELAIQLAHLCRNIYTELNKVMGIETEHGPIRKLHAAFQEALIHDLTEDGFADMFAQTITYGLFSTAVSGTVEGEGTYVDAERMVDLIPVTNPFLKEMLATFLTVGGRKGKLDFDEIGIQEVVELLNDSQTDLQAVLRDFGNRGRGEDPVIHFYEDFLHVYDRERKVQRGVFYTPQPVVSYIVRSVHALLQSQFGLEDGLADTTTWGQMVARTEGLEIPAGMLAEDAFVQILDPATGTATFLVEVIDLIHRTMLAKWQAEGKGDVACADDWNKYVPKHLLPRLHGYEIMMAPYAIAHLKIGLKLADTGYRFGSNERARVYLTNALEPPGEGQMVFDFLPALAHEAVAVNEVKQNRRFTILLGNPPYSKVSENMSAAAQRLVERYKYVDGEPLGERKHWLQDDYVKFISMAQEAIDSAHLGVSGMITNHGFLDNPTFRGMRQNLRESYTLIEVLDLHGNAHKSATSPDGLPDENVFDIMQGVAISLMTKNCNRLPQLVHANLYGTRLSKYKRLSTTAANSIEFNPASCATPWYFFAPKGIDGENEYNGFWRITDIMPTNSTGILTARDRLVIDFEDAPILDRMATFVDKSLTDNEVKEKLKIKENYSWRVSDARASLWKNADVGAYIRSVLYRPFDVRRIVYHPSVIWRPRQEVMQHLGRPDNLALVTSRMTKGEQFAHVMVTREITEVISLSSKTSNNAFVFPFQLIPHIDKGTLRLDADETAPNFSPAYLNLVRKTTGEADQPRPYELFCYLYSVLHSPEYRRRYMEFLKIDFPRLPLARNSSLFQSLAALGSKLIAIQLLEQGDLSNTTCSFFGSMREVRKVGWANDTVWIDAGATDKELSAGTSGFGGISQDEWQFRIGGYQVCEKWLKDRKGRTLAECDFQYYGKIVAAIRETIRIMGVIDETIDQHGGWPEAFVTEPIEFDAEKPIAPFA
ncbi:type ISP restriction/modification enzyme [Aeoliella sp. SH292]|uniref:type ISP restriction/modification enzyme n=1 Tax=Aeoliella sp. SH292 TaxID=3454464 RepID=UPI003F999A88